MKRKFITNLLLLLFLNVLIKPFWIFGIDVTVQNMVGDESYGLYFSLLNFSMILNIILDLGITNYNNKNIAQHRQLLRKHISNIVGLKFILAGIYALVCIVTALLIGYREVQLHLLIFLILNQFLISFTLYLRSNISGLHLFRTDSLLSVLDRTLMIIICSVLLFTNITNHHFRIEWFVYAQTAAYLLTSLITLAVVLSRTGKLKLYFDRHFFIVFLRKTYPYALLALLMSFYNRIDSVMLERLLPDGKEQAGIYAHAFRLLDAVSMFGVLFAGLLLPIFARMIKQKEEIGSMVQFSFLLLFVPAIVISLSSGFYDQEIMTLLNYSNMEFSASIFQILMISFLGIATTYIFGTLLTANGSIKQLNYMALVGMGINIAVNLLLIPELKALGSAWASLATQLFTALAQTILAVTILKLTVNYRLIAKLGVFIGFVTLMGYISRQIDVWYLGYFTMIAASVLFAFFTRLINLRALTQIIRNDNE
ncbi:MAG TPA: oligosaccharide flippase family protein [Prolixibacteraceae bacterium]|nr:oligosaccharide flippase family protein [Prolixibacteraceae bacterium]HPR85339.1 oligosaccharide flippase family protein [Prolixibacteraceae bacterium]